MVIEGEPGFDPHCLPSVTLMKDHRRLPLNHQFIVLTARSAAFQKVSWTAIVLRFESKIMPAHGHPWSSSRGNRVETEMQYMEMSPRRRTDIDYAIYDNSYFNGGSSPQYTSLKDIISSPQSAGSLLPFEAGIGFSSANITIKNQLVKHAASMYLQSTAMLATRNQNCFPSFWTTAVRKNPACTCLGAITRPICSFLQNMANQIGGIWDRRRIFV